MYLHRHDSICHPSYRGVFYIPRLLDWRVTESQIRLYGCCKHRFLHSSPAITRTILLVCSVTNGKTAEDEKLLEAHPGATVDSLMKAQNKCSSIFLGLLA